MQVTGFEPARNGMAELTWNRDTELTWNRDTEPTWNRDIELTWNRGIEPLKIGKLKQYGIVKLNRPQFIASGMLCIPFCNYKTGTYKQNNYPDVKMEL